MIRTMKQRLQLIFLAICVFGAVILIFTNYAHAEDDLNFWGNGFTYDGKDYVGNGASVDLSKGKVVSIGYYTKNAGWDIVGVPLTEYGTGTDKHWSYRLEASFNAKVDINNKQLVMSYCGGFNDHEHICEWVTVKEATESVAGLRAYRCRLCSCNISEEIIPTSTVTEKRMMDTIEKNTTKMPLTIDLGTTCNIPRADMDKIRESNMTVTLKYQYNGRKYTVTIPAGKCYDMCVDYYGPEFLRSIYNGTVE